MYKAHLLPLLVLLTSYSFAQPAARVDTSWKNLYREAAPKINDLVHTKLDVRFDYQKAYLYGKAWITLKPHFYSTDSLMLDAKGMNINKVAIYKNGKTRDLTYRYDSLNLNINLDRLYKRDELYTIFIDYTSKPNEFQTEGSAAITDAKGLYFINPTGADTAKPVQIWTQGETEANSVWFPTIDKPDQKTTEEIIMTVPAKYVTLSNGLLVNQKANGDGTRTDTWKMDLPHCPYLFFMGVGDFAIIKDKYKNKEVAYYVEKKYAPVARKIFGYTPEMMQFFSTTLGVDFPWPKYDQIVGRDYVSGAMENTSATLHQESAQQNARKLVDGNAWESVIAHELFHQWFGDYVTAESWSNITVNESMATLGSQLWNEYKHGKDAGDQERYSSMRAYLLGNNEKKNLVRYYYRDKEDVFDAVSYNKGGGILQMLRKYVGDSAFFKSLNLYLNTNKFKSAEAAHMRLAFEEVTGKDLHWFWNQWYYGSGHPKLNISYDYNVNTKIQQVFVSQTQDDKLFTLPIAIDVYN
ncbi:MAG: M1 family metallopeptidase, partial [Bacteroidota bacterium]|nr:M1 family metallopeptidase [Bacteroidota bacterium]